MLKLDVNKEPPSVDAFALEQSSVKGMTDGMSWPRP